MVKKTADSLILQKMNTDGVVVVNIEHNKFLNGQNSNVDAMNKKPGMSEDILGSNGNITFIAAQCDTTYAQDAEKARGYVISDYQDRWNRVDHFSPRTHIRGSGEYSIQWFQPI